MSFSLQRIFSKYSGFLRTVKAVYVINNLLNARALQRNKSLYKQFGLKKSIFSPLSKHDFERVRKGEVPWIDQADALEKLSNHSDIHQFSPTVQAQIRQFIEQGYLILENFVPATETDALNQEIEQLLAEGKAGFNFTGRKIFNLFETSTIANERFFRRPELIQILTFLLGKKIIPFQTLNFNLGSEQRPHSDAIHMTTEPQGFMIAAWYALEDCTEMNGSLVYYPGSHRLPFVSTNDYNSGDSTFLVGNESNARYEDKIAEIIEQNNLQPATFLAKRGDVLIWHSNLIHGGSPIKGIPTDGKPITRKSMVCHYFADDVICYHEMLHRPALIKNT
jgi:ectoine hydroxylase